MADFREFQKQYNSYLMHHGILGMHWGIRRYQNPDGSLTPEGLVRYKYNNNTDRYEKRDKKAQELVRQHPELYGNPNDEEKSRIRAKKQRAKQEMRELAKDGFKQESDFLDLVSKTDKSGNYISLYCDKEGSFKKSKDNYETFMRDEKSHINGLIKEIPKLMNDRHLDVDAHEIQRFLQSDKCKNAYEFSDKGVEVWLGNYEIPALGYHTIAIDYDMLNRRYGNWSLEG